MSVHLEAPNQRSSLVKSQPNQGVSTWISKPTPSLRGVSFLQLPPEIRLEIYYLILKTSEPLHLTPISRDGRGSDSQPAWDHSPIPAVSLLRTCKLIHHETLPVLYGGNRFDITCNGTYTWALQLRGRGACSALKDLTLNLHDLHDMFYAAVESGRRRPAASSATETSTSPPCVPTSSKLSPLPRQASLWTSLSRHCTDLKDLRFTFVSKNGSHQLFSAIGAFLVTPPAACSAPGTVLAVTVSRQDSKHDHPYQGEIANWVPMLHRYAAAARVAEIMAVLGPTRLQLSGILSKHQWQLIENLPLAGWNRSEGVCVRTKPGRSATEHVYRSTGEGG